MSPATALLVVLPSHVRGCDVSILALFRSPAQQDHKCGATDFCRSRPGTDVLLRPSSVNTLRAEHRQLPSVGALIVADEICVAVGASEFEVPVVGRQPGVEHFRDDDATISKNQHARRLFAAVACVALDANAKQLLLSHGSS
jgi:hypothetical protein